MDRPYSGIEILEFVADARNYNSWIADLVERGIGSSTTLVLDFGAGNGTFAKIFRQHTERLICIELDATLSAHLKKNGLTVKNSLAEVSPASVSAAYSLNVLEHIEDDVAALRDLHRVLEPQGRLVLFVPAFNILYSSFDAKFGHHRRYRGDILQSRVEAAGFRVLYRRYGDSLGFFAALAFKFLDRGSGNVSRRTILIYDRAVFPISRILDAIFGRFFGKNLYLIAEKP